MTCVHATAVCFGRRGILIRGAPGSGKSSLALRLLDAEGFGIGQQALRARLISDDQVEIQRIGSTISLSSPDKLKGLLEIRGHGIVTVKPAKMARLALVVDLMPRDKFERLPDKTTIDVLGLEVLRLTLPEREIAGPARLRAVLNTL
jgi:HPr kinase/phosphorylase